MNTIMPQSFTSEDADRLLGLADQFLQDWKENEGKNDPECAERRAEWNAIRPLLTAAPVLLDACKTLAEDCRMALSGEWDKGDEGFQASLEVLESVIAEATGGASLSSTAIGKHKPDAEWKPAYSRWRHGGWYIRNLSYPSGAVGCVSRNYPDGKWRIVCDERDPQPTYASRDAAALAERELIRATLDQATKGDTASI